MTNYHNKIEKHQKTDDKASDKEIIPDENYSSLFGAKKRKTYKRSEFRATTPADSGFKEPSELSQPASPQSPNEENIEEKKDCVVQTRGRRTSSRLKAIKEEFNKLSPAQQNLKKSLEKCRTKCRSFYSKRIDTIELKRWTPRVMIRSMSLREIGRLTDDWSFLDHMKFFPRFRVTAQRTTLDGKKEMLVDGAWRDHEVSYKMIAGELFPWERAT